MNYDVDQGTGFGLWPDPTARLIYDDLMSALLSGVDISGRVADLGGGNGLLRKWISHIVTVDHDPAKMPDVLADISSYRGEHDLLILRYVLHYMDDDAVRSLFRHIDAFHNGRLLVIQFVNENLAAKLANSIGETKWFRREAHLRGLLESAGWRVEKRRAFDYTVEADFYRWRLNHPNPVAHAETIVAYELVRA
jgi:hypothetical protein